MDNITVTYGQHISPIDPYNTLFPTDGNVNPFDRFMENQKRNKRSLETMISPILMAPSWIAEEIEVPIVFKPTPFSKPIYLTSVMRKLKRTSNKREQFISNLKLRKNLPEKKFKELYLNEHITKVKEYQTAKNRRKRAAISHLMTHHYPEPFWFY